MKKFIIVTATCSIIVIGAGWLGIKSLVTNVEADTQDQSQVMPIVNTWQDEPDDHNTGNSLSTAIFCAAQVATATSYDANSSKEMFDTTIGYTEGALKWADKVNASKEIKSQLNKALVQAKHKDASKASELLLKLNAQYNNGNSQNTQKELLKSVQGLKK